MALKHQIHTWAVEDKEDPGHLTSARQADVIVLEKCSQVPVQGTKPGSASVPWKGLPVRTAQSHHAALVILPWIVKVRFPDSSVFQDCVHV